MNNKTDANYWPFFSQAKRLILSHPESHAIDGFYIAPDIIWVIFWQKITAEEFDTQSHQGEYKMGVEARSFVSNTISENV